jgi:hypothetical protein
MSCSYGKLLIQQYPLIILGNKGIGTQWNITQQPVL